MAQLYILPEKPNTSVCTNFYRITDYEVLRSVLDRRAYGHILHERYIMQEPQNSTRVDTGFERMVFRSSVRKSYFSTLLREMVWLLGRWNNAQLRHWLDDFDPEVVFYQPGNNIFMYNLVLTICKQYGIPLILLNTEDYYLKQSTILRPFEYFHRFLQRREFRKLMQYASYAIYANDQLKRDFEGHFILPSRTILTSSTIIAEHTLGSNFPPRVSYLGNTGLNRWKSLIDIGKALQVINKALYIDVYTQRLDSKAREAFTLENGIRLHGPVDSSTVVKIMKNSDLVLHVEDFSDYTIRDLKHAFSTKIADSLACGTCFFAYGPEEIASIQYLKENDAACVVTDTRQLEMTLRQILENNELRKSYVEKALKLAQQRHNPEKNAKVFEEIVKSVSWSRTA